MTPSHFGCVLIAACGFTAGASAGAYTQTTGTNDAGGGSVASGRYTQVGSVNYTGGRTAVGGPLNRSLFVGQLSEPAGLAVTPASATLAETASFVLSAQVVDDDATRSSASDVRWSIVSGPVLYIDAAGVGQLGAVGRPGTAVVRATAGSFSADATVAVLDTLPDNYRTYAGDGLPDFWQLDYFGEDNPLAAPSVDATGTGQDNRFKYTAGLNPVDRSASNAVFVTELRPLAGAPDARQIVFRPRYPDRTYTVLVSSDLVSWAPLAAPVVSDAGETRTVIDPAAAGTRQFYRVAITKP